MVHRHAGGFSFVFLVKDCDTGALYALKRVLVQESQEMKAIQREIDLMVMPHQLSTLS